MKKILLIFFSVFMVFSLMACGQERDDDDDRKKTKKKDKTKTEEVDAEYEDDEQEDGEKEDAEQDETEENEDIENIQEEEVLQEVSEILFEVEYADAMEYATLTGITANGDIVWTYDTPQYAVAQLERLIPIGIFNDMYYYQEAGTILAIDPQSAKVIWKNEEFVGSCSGFDFDENGTIYLCGYFGPDLMVIDKDGKTVLRQDVFKSEYYWPHALDYEQGYVFITYEQNMGYYWEEKYFWQDDTKYKYSGYTLSYSLTDGSIGYEYNVLEPGMMYQGFYQRANGAGRPDEMQIDYLGDNAYMINVNLAQEAYMANMVGYIDNDSIVFSEEISGYYYAGRIIKSGEEINLIITETNNEAISLNYEYIFGTDPIATEVTPEQIMSGISDVSASSELSEYNMTHSAELMLDGDLCTGWVEGVAGQGLGESVTFVWDDEYLISGFCINAGYQKSDSLYVKNARPQIIEVVLSNGKVETFTLEDYYGGQICELMNPSYLSSITITIISVYPGTTYEDTVISEISFY